MSLRTVIETRYQTSTDGFTGCAEFGLLESGKADRASYERFLANVVRAHLRSPKILAFVYAMAPSDASADLLHNLLEELGIEEADATSHPDMLINMAKGAGMGDLLPQLEQRANEDLRQFIVDPLLYGTLKEVGLAALAEMVSFEYMLSRTASRIAAALHKHMGLSEEALAWFSHHAEVDSAHAAQGMTRLEQYIAYYDFSADDTETILDMALRENVFIKRYFGELALANATLMTG